MLGDAPGAYLTAAGSPLRYYGNQATNIPTGAEFIRTFGKTTRESARTATVNSYNFTTPNLPLVADRSGTAERGELYEYGGFKTTADGTRRARLRLEQLEGQRHLMFGSGNAADLRPGYKFELDDRSGANLQNEYLVTAVRHSGFRRTTNGVASLYYGNQFEVIPAALPYRPARKTPRPVASTSTAIVTGPAGEEIWTDNYGRVKVQFHWDRSGARDETASAWVRVASPWAGPGWGMIFTPRVGQEVKVEFVNGDPDEPIVTGSFYNGLNMPPYALPTDKTKSGIKTHSSPNGTAANFNEIRFEDKKGAEELYLHAEKDLNLEVKNDVTFAVNHDLALGVDHDLSLEVGNNLTISTPNNLTITASAGLGLNAPNNPAFALNVGGTVAAPAVNVSGTVTATSFSGSGAALSGVNAVNTDTLDGQHGAFYQNLANLTGTLPDARLSANVALLNNSQTFTGAKTFSGLLTLNNTLQVQSSVFLNDRDIQLRGDAWHGLGWYGNPKFFAGVNVNGPVLYGNGGGGLGTISGTTTNLALLWNTSGNVGIGTPTPTHVLHVNSASTTNTMRLTGPGVNGAGAKLNFGDGEYVYLHEVSDDFLRVQATRMGIGRAPTANKFELEGDASKTTAGSWLANSDARIKQDIQPITNALEKISQVRLVSFRYKDDYRQQHPSIEPRAYVNVVAQEFQQVFPEAVQSSGEKLATGENILQVDTYPLTIYSAAAVQELQQRLTVELQRRDAENAALQARLEKLEQLLKVSRGDSQ